MSPVSNSFGRHLDRAFFILVLTLELSLCIGLATPTFAQTRLTWESVETPELPGFDTFSVTATSDFPPIRGFTITFTGPLNQIYPAGQATPLQDLNDQFVTVGALPEQDTQFLFKSSELSVPVIGAAESEYRLTASMSGLAVLNVNSSIAIAQLVIPDGAVVEYRAEFDETGSGCACYYEASISNRGGGGDNPTAVGVPQAGSVLSLSGEFDDPKIVSTSSIVLSDINSASLNDLVINDLSIVGDDAELFTAAIHPNNPLGIDLGFRPAAAGQPDPDQVYRANLLIDTNGGPLTYRLVAQVPEPSTAVLVALALGLCMALVLANSSALRFASPA